MQSWLLRCITSHDTVWHWIHQPLRLMTALHAEASVPGCIWFPYIPAGGPTRSVVHLSLMLHDESLINSCNLGTGAVRPLCVGKRADIDILYPVSASAARLLVFLPGEVRTGEGKITAVPRRSDRINTQTEEKQNKKKKKKKLFHRLWGVEMFRPGFGKSCCAGVNCSRWLSLRYGSLWGDQGAGGACICNAEEFAECSFSPKRAGERDVCVLSGCLRTFFCFSYFLWNTAEQEKNSLTVEGQLCSENVLLHKWFTNLFFQAFLKICANDVQPESFRELIKA